MSLDARLKKLEQTASSSQFGAVFDLKVGGYELKGKRYETWEQLPGGSFVFVPEQITMQEYEDKTLLPESFRERWIL